MAPELLREENATNQSDVFSVGVLMYELLTGKQPFAADSLPTVIYNITEKPHVPLRELRSEAPPIIEHIVDRCLAKNIQTRYKSCLDVAADLSLAFDQMKLTQEELSGKAKFDRIKDLSFFKDFPDSEIWEVINAASWNEYKPGDEIIQEGEVEMSFFVVNDGRVAVSKGVKELDMLGSGDGFGEMGFIASTKRTATIVAKTNVSALKINSSLIDKASLNCQLRFKNVFFETMVGRLSQANTVLADRSV